MVAQLPPFFKQKIGGIATELGGITDSFCRIDSIFSGGFRAIPFLYIKTKA